ncbi:ribosomal-processing cysteine protease Prp [Lacticaseibacillus paracasei]|uniref:ribosomal-processing cysteine protease Prp n=1 Tax=Lacticaseibacillus paracasei TaxID=1597 RepID=UPI00259FEA42|nr:ribosomal-processing cysteine protease Prp [Lacticaseibacillus paracasei]MDM7525531.1 ribosomal-processing cysteine protease Prp [Lacticaseibacillus paracasei]
MIKAIFHRDEHGDIVSFSLTGHADAGKTGKDIVCAAVSAVSIGAVNGIEGLAWFEPDVIADEVHGGHLQMAIKTAITGEQLHISQILLENLLLELQSIQDQYPDRLTITTKQLEQN